ncbi:MAG TPA: phosphoglycerate dehydrogenase [Myxococcota bacterium]|jgi:D-3-phosphoglycerate dehydrogenase|nr:phosphoglycerate dehydrogenase [Myxococcota bacterium]
MRVLVADALPEGRLAELRSEGRDLVVDYRPELKAEALGEALAAAAPAPPVEVLVVRSTEVTAAMIARAEALALIVRAGAGVNTIDVAAASARGILVANCPGKNALAVAELAMGLLVALDRRIPDNVAAARTGRWDKKTFSAAQGLHGRRLGVLGFGAIGRAVAARAQGFGMRVSVWSRSLDEGAAAAAGVARAEELDALLPQCDAVTLHLPASGDTKGLLDARRLGLLKPGALLVNTARAELVDEEAVLAAARAGRLRYGTDVVRGEPAAARAELASPLAAAEGVYVTHHIGASTEQAQDAIAAEAVRLVRAFAATGEVPGGGVVNLRKRSRAAVTLVVRHLDRVGVLAEVLGVLREAGLNVQEMENTLFEGAAPGTAVARIGLETAPRAETVAAIRARRDVILHAQVFD